MKQIPMLSKDLIEQLAKDESELTIKPTKSIESIMYEAGRWSIIKELMYRQEYFEKNNQNKNKVEM